MNEIMLWIFAVAGLPMILDLFGRLLAATSEAIRWISNRMDMSVRCGPLANHRAPAHIGPSGKVLHGH